MATTTSSGGVLQSLGLGSGLDISTLVSELTTAEMNGPNARIKREQTSVTAQVSAIASLKSALSTFQSSLTSLVVGSGFAARNVTTSNADVLKATATSSAALGSYQVEVEQLAQSQQLLSGNFVGGGAAVVGTGTLSFTSDGKSFSIDIDGSKQTLAGIRDAINSASGNQLVSATLVYGQTGAQLVLTSLKSGAAAGLTIEATGGDGGLAQLTWGAGNTTHFTEQQAAQDAIIQVSGVEHHSTSNQVSGAIDGVTLNLVSALPNTNIAISISNDTETVVKQVQAFATAFNTMQTSVAALDSFDPNTRKAGTLFGDAMFSGLKRQIYRALTDSVVGVTGSFNSLATLGVTVGVDGKMTINDSKLRSALSIDFKAVSSVFSGAGGVLSRTNSQITSSLLTGGGVSARNVTLAARQSAIDREKILIDLRTEKVRERYLTKFNAMDTLLAQMQNTSTFLNQQLDALNRASKT